MEINCSEKKVRIYFENLSPHFYLHNARLTLRYPPLHGDIALTINFFSFNDATNFKAMVAKKIASTPVLHKRVSDGPSTSATSVVAAMALLATKVSSNGPYVLTFPFN